MRTTSWHAPLRTVFGKNDPSSASFGSIFIFFEQSLRRLHIQK